MGKAHLDCKENTPCGGHVRYDVDEDDMISYSSFTDCAECRKCKKCTWNRRCPEAAVKTDPPLIDVPRNLSSNVTLRDLIWSTTAGPAIISEAEVIMIAKRTSDHVDVLYTGPLGTVLWTTIKPLLEQNVVAIRRQLESTLILL